VALTIERAARVCVNAGLPSAQWLIYPEMGH